MEFVHTPVLLSEVIEGLNIKRKGRFVDCTIGGGGHSSFILSHVGKEGQLYGFDRDENAIEACKKRFKGKENVTLFKANFHDAPEILKENDISELDGILIDLGVSSHQIDTAERGFSFLHDGKLDMRMDNSQSLSAYEVVNSYPKEKLIKILYNYGEESNAKNIVQKICQAREIKPIETTLELKNIVESAFPKKVIYGKGGVTKQTFQAIRIEVNSELDGLEEAMRELFFLLKKGGRLAVISFHSLEDRIVKNLFKDLATDCICPPKTPICICGHKAEGKLITRKPITASEDELKVNSRSAPAKLRIIERV